MQDSKGLGLIPSPVDKRDILMSSILPQFTVPQRFEVQGLTPIRDQKNEGTCVGFACTVGMKEWQEQQEHKHYFKLSPRYLYQKCKEIDGLPGEGTYIRLALDILATKGVSEEHYWPYVPCQPGTPQSEADENAEQYKIKAYASLDSLETMKKSLLVNGPFVLGVPVYMNWWKDEVGKTGEIPMPSDSQMVGGHAICVVGYDEGTSMFKFKNSWSENWGDKGYGYLPYDYLELRDDRNRKYCEAWSATDLINDPKSFVKAKEKVLDQLNIEYTEENTIKFH
ncbi:C1 family peptidase [Paenibacillus sp. VT-400]|uniref:C1 family peptidase n=1 Tax=Paenibacillus sp. VT-400 TaxID=1495853 RepID=UPI00069FBE9D|nr:C1 family peptidase [Paenibacillus sp. VT-400]